MELLNKLLEAVPANLQLICMAGALVAYAGLLIFQNYLSDKAVLENKKRELEMLKLSAELDSATDRSKTSELNAWKEKSFQEITEYFEKKKARADAWRAPGQGLLTIIREKFQNRKEWPVFFSFGALGGFFVSGAVIVYTFNKQETFEPQVIEFMMWFYSFLVIFDILMAGAAGVLLAQKTRLSAFFGGIVGAAFLGPFGITLFAALLKLQVIPLNVVVK